ncbi:IS66 Orf2 like protein [compost metagenome]
MMRPDGKVEKVYLYPKPVDFRKSIDGLAALVELDIKVAVFDPVLFVFLNKSRNRVKILYWERNGFCLWNTCRWRPQWRTTKRCCHGIARLKYIAKCSTHRGSGGAYEAFEEQERSNHGLRR